MLAAGLIHVIASDAHDTVGRRPELRSSLRAAGFSPAQIAYFTEEGPRAVLEGRIPRAAADGRRTPPAAAPLAARDDGAPQGQAARAC